MSCDPHIIDKVVILKDILQLLIVSLPHFFRLFLRFFVNFALFILISMCCYNFRVGLPPQGSGKVDYSRTVRGYSMEHSGFGLTPRRDRKHSLPTQFFAFKPSQNSTPAHLKPLSGNSAMMNSLTASSPP